ncbi:uncharacterized protein LOC122380725 [Amphibalanus amphitrite]|uniref:uncharacterized protein LOC122373039 n=1 Tax=Amphibalanus amphitrite TaxID=1232801 RepID=UPI001C9244F8|nr:uncharacterized protein LOC122373039 [Amphibalanus amphitrite]XP_043220066.1 uncharacterized protein LOC122380725 [Amphibalanus amphitrite]
MMQALDDGHGQRRQKKSKRSSREKDSAEKGEHSCRLDGESLDAVKSIIDKGIEKVTKLMEEKFRSMERRIEIMEGELFLKDAETNVLKDRVSSQEATIKALQEQLEGIDTNRRMNSLILKSEEFGKRERDEDIEGKVISVLNRRLPEVHVTGSDIQTAHRLQGDSTVIVKFFKTKVKDDIYERRMKQARVQNHGDRPAAPLYINESLSAMNKEIFNALLEAKKRKKIYTVYSRRGAVFCKLDSESRGQKMVSMDQVTSLLGGAARPDGRRPAAAGGADVDRSGAAAAADVRAVRDANDDGGGGARGGPLDARLAPAAWRSGRVDGGSGRSAAEPGSGGAAADGRR